jgi:hypothetical protein
MTRIRSLVKILGYSIPVAALAGALMLGIPQKVFAKETIRIYATWVSDDACQGVPLLLCKEIVKE